MVTIEVEKGNLDCGAKYVHAVEPRKIAKVHIYHITAETYSGLIEAIDQIDAKDLNWTSRNEIYYESLDDNGRLRQGPSENGLPHKTEGVWKASLRTGGRYPKGS